MTNLLWAVLQEMLGLQKRAAGGEGGDDANSMPESPPGEWATVGKKQRNFTQRGDEELSVRLKLPLLWCFRDWCVPRTHPLRFNDPERGETAV